jgi:hypothetical protein
MSKIRIGDNVVVKETNVIGTVVGRELKKSSDGSKKVTVEYVVKTGDGFENYKPYTRKEIEKVSTPTEVDTANVSTYPRLYNYEHKCADGRTVVMTGVVDIYHVAAPGIKSQKNKILTVGYSICHPQDENDKNIGAEIAYRRALTKPLSVLATPFTGEFKEDFVTVILKAKAQFVEENMQKFIERDKS